MYEVRSGIPSTKFQAPNSKYQNPNTKIQAPKSKYQNPSTKFQIPTIQLTTDN